MKITDSKVHSFGRIDVISDYSDTPEGFAFRLRIKHGAVGKWVNRYESFASVEQNGRKWLLCTDYWRGTLPTEVAFEVTEPDSTQPFSTIETLSGTTAETGKP